MSGSRFSMFSFSCVLSGYSLFSVSKKCPFSYLLCDLKARKLSKMYANASTQTSQNRSSINQSHQPHHLILSIQSHLAFHSPLPNHLHLHLQLPSQPPLQVQLTRAIPLSLLALSLFLKFTFSPLALRMKSLPSTNFTSNLHFLKYTFFSPPQKFQTPAYQSLALDPGGIELCIGT